MRRFLPLATAALAGLAAGGLVALALPSFATPESSGIEVPATVDVSVDPEREDAAVKPRPNDDGLLVVWSARGLPEGFAEEVAALPQVTRVTAVTGDLVDLVGSHTADGAVVDDLDDGWAIPLDVLAITPEEYADFLPKGDQAGVAQLRSGEVLLGASSADLRELSVGDVVVVGNAQLLTVRAVVDDALIGAAEAVITRDDAARVGVGTDRFLLLAHRGDRAALEAAIRERAEVDVRVRAPGETTYLRHGDAVLPQVHVKREFGEFAYRRIPGALAIEQDPGWVRDHLVEVEVPLLGTVRCHRNVGAQLAGALRELEERDLGHLVDPERFAGCHAPRLIGEGQGLSRHAWGIAVDLASEEAVDSSDQDPRVVETFARWGFTSGGFWLVPDPAHFEYVGAPQPSPPKVDDALGQS